MLLAEREKYEKLLLERKEEEKAALLQKCKDLEVKNEEVKEALQAHTLTSSWRRTNIDIILILIQDLYLH